MFPFALQLLMGGFRGYSSLEPFFFNHRCPFPFLPGDAGRDRINSRQRCKLSADTFKIKPREGLAGSCESATYYGYAIYFTIKSSYLKPLSHFIIFIYLFEDSVWTL